MSASTPPVSQIVLPASTPAQRAALVHDAQDTESLLEAPLEPPHLAEDPDEDAALVRLVCWVSAGLVALTVAGPWLV